MYANPDRVAGSYPLPQVIAADGLVALRIADGEQIDLGLIDLLP